MNALLISSLIVTSFFAVIFIVIRVVRGGIPGLIFKIVASLSFFAFGTVLAVSTGYPVLAVLFPLGFFFGVGGDALLDMRQALPQKKFVFTNLGMLTFAVGHAFYLTGIIYYAAQFQNVTLAALVALIALPLTAGGMFLVIKVFKMDFKGYFLQSFGYLLILSYVALLTLSLAWMGGVPGIALFTTGAFLFLASDIVLSFQYFGGQEKNGLLTIVNHVLYYAAQLSYVAAMAFLI